MNPTIRLSPSDLHDRITSIEHAYCDRDERDALIREALDRGKISSMIGVYYIAV